MVADITNQDPCEALHMHYLWCLRRGVGLERVEGTVPKTDLPKANQSLEAASDLGSPPSVPGHCLFPGLPLLHTKPKRAAQLWMHSGPTLLNNCPCDLGQGTSFPTPPGPLYLHRSADSPSDACYLP